MTLKLLPLSLVLLGGCVIYAEGKDGPCGRMGHHDAACGEDTGGDDETDDNGDSDGSDDGNGDGGGGDGGGGDGGTDTGADTGGDTAEPDPALLFTLSPDLVWAGETDILSLTANQTFDYASIADLEFLGDVTICAFEAREDELLLTVSTDKLVAPGAVDLLIRMSDGENHLADDILTREGGVEGGEPAAAGCGG